MNQFDEIIARIEEAWPRYQAWYVPRAVGGMIWCARRRNGTGRVINTSTAAGLAEQIEQAEKESS
jgi:hypothetical protein